MKKCNFDTMQKARDYYWASDMDHAFLSYLESFESSPKAWWLAMEAIRCKRAATPCVLKRKFIIYSPNYLGNSYQRNLYSAYKRFNYEVIPVDLLVLDEKLAMATCSQQLVFHQHWLKEIYWKALSMETGMATIERHIAIIKALKSYGARICWTLHNLIDHDVTPLQKDLSDFALRQMTEVTDHIFIHATSAGEELSSHCKIDLSKKYVVLEHPLYDNLLHSAKPHLPEEIKLQEIDGRRILLSCGMIRPYKGVPDLIRAFQEVVQENEDHGLYLIIAGQVYDPDVSETLNSLDTYTRSYISLVNRRLHDDELAGLMQLAHVSVLPYRKILTSGSYFLATTFAKPTVAPQKGMFSEIIKEGETGFLYDGSQVGLTKVLSYISMLSNAELARVGDNALNASKNLTISKISTRFFSLLEGS